MSEVKLYWLRYQTINAYEKGFAYVEIDDFFPRQVAEREAEHFLREETGDFITPKELFMKGPIHVTR